MDRLVFSSLASISDPSARTQLNNEIANMSTTGFKKSFMNASTAIKVSGPGFDTCGAASALILHTETARARAPRPIRPPARCVLGSGSLPLY